MAPRSTYASVVAVEEKSVIDYNKGNPDGVLSPGETPPRPPRSARRDLPVGGHAVLRQPVHRARQRRGSTPTRRPPPPCSSSFVQQPDNQRTVLEYGFRPNNPTVPLAGADRRRQRRRPGPADGHPRGPVARGADRHPRLVGRAAQGSPGAARARHLGVDGRDRHGRRQDPPRPRPGGRGRRARPVQGDRRRRAVGVQHRPRGARPERARARADRPDRRRTRRTSPRPSRPSSRRTARRCTRSPRRRTRAMLETYDPARSTPSCC